MKVVIVMVVAMVVVMIAIMVAVVVMMLDHHCDKEHLLCLSALHSACCCVLTAPLGFRQAVHMWDI